MNLWFFEPYPQEPQRLNLLAGSSFRVFYSKVVICIFFLCVYCWILCDFSILYGEKSETFPVFLTGSSLNCHPSCRPNSPRRGVAVAVKRETDYARGRTYGPSMPGLDDLQLS